MQAQEAGIDTRRYGADLERLGITPTRPGVSPSNVEGLPFGLQDATPNSMLPNAPDLIPQGPLPGAPELLSAETLPPADLSAMEALWGGESSGAATAAQPGSIFSTAAAPGSSGVPPHSMRRR